MAERAVRSAVATSNKRATAPTQRAEVVVETAGLTKRYGEVTAVNSLDLRLYKGEVFGLLGPNGAGKTTTILMMMGLTEPAGGAV